MKKSKLFLSTMFGTSAILAPILISSNCAGKTGNENETGSSRDHVLFGHSFADGKEQETAFSDLASYYNEKIVAPRRAQLQELIKNEKDSQKKKAYEEELASTLPVHTKRIGSSYGAAHQKVATDLENKNEKELPNITLNYSSTISQIAKYDRAIDFSDQKYGDLKIERSSFNEKFTTSNDAIDGLVKGKNYALPLAKSSQGFGINGPIFKYVFKTLKTAGYTLSENIKNTFKVETKDWENDLKELEKDDRFGKAIKQEDIKKIFGEPKTGNVDINDDIFEEFKTFVEFIQKAIKIFEKSKDPLTSNVSLFGIDDMSGFLNTVIYSAVGADHSKMPMRVQADATGKVKVDFKSITNSEDETTKKIKEIFQLVMSAAKEGALKIYGGGEYASAEATNHLLGANVGSTAGYSHNFVRDGNFKAYLKIAKANSTSYVDVKVAATVEKVEADKIVIKDGKYKNNIYKSNKTGAKSHDYVSLNAETDGKLSSFVQGREIFAIQNGKDDADFIKQVESLGIFDLRGDFKKKDTNYRIYQLNEENKELLKNAKKENGKYEVVVPTSASTLQESELIVKSPFRKYEKESTAKTAFLQGPNLYGIKIDANSDKATLRFVKFLLSSDKIDLPNYKPKENEAATTKETPAEHISRIASYIVPYKGFENLKLFDNDRNKYNKLAFDTFKNSEVKLYEEPASIYSNDYREKINSAYKTLAQSARKTGTEADFEAFVNTIRTAEGIKKS